MAMNVAWIRLSAATSAGVVACAFAHFYSFVSRMTIQRGIALPFLTDLALHCSPFAYVGPVILFVLGRLLLRKRETGSAGFECTVSLMWLLALFWALFTIFAWQLPRIQPGQYIR